MFVNQWSRVPPLLGVMTAPGFIFTNYESGDWTFEGAGDSAGSGTMTTGSNDSGGYADGVTLVGDFSVKATISASGTWVMFGVFPVSELATFVGDHASGDGQLDLMTNSYHWSRNEGFHKGGTIVDATIDGVNDDIRIERIGTVLKAYINDVLEYTDNSAVTTDMYLSFSHSNGTIRDLSGLQYSA